MKNDKALVVRKNNQISDIKRAAWNSLSEESQNAYQSDFNLFFSFIKKNPNSVTANDILSYINHLEKKGYKNNSINRKISSISKMYKILVIAGEAKTNPVDTLRQFKNVSRKTNKEIRVTIKIEDIKKAIKKVSTLHDKKTVLIIRTLAMTGLRISEFTGIKNCDISSHNSGNKIIRIVGKGKKERFIFLPNKFIKEIKKLYPDTKETDHLFYSNKKERYDRRVLWALIKSFFYNRIGKDVHPHLLRHFFATYKINVEKQDIKAVSKFLGHSDVSITLQSYVDTALDVDAARIKI